MDLRLDLSQHCIATEVKKRYNKALSNYFKRKGDASLLESEISILKDALEHLDFPGMRARYPQLSGKHEADVILSGGTGGRLSLTLDGTTLNLMFIMPKNTNT